MKPFLRRWAGLILNGVTLLFFAVVAVFDYAGTNVDWTDIVGEEQAKVLVPTILMVNVFLRVFVTRTKRAP